MSDNEDAVLRGAFADLHRETTHLVRPPGAAATLTQARRRRTRWIAATAVVAVLVLAIPAIVFAAAGSRRAAPPVILGPTSAPSEPPVPLPTPSTVPSLSPVPTSQSPTNVAGELANATLTLDWSWLTISDGCKSGAVRFSQGAFEGAPSVMVYNVVHGDVNRDGVQDVAAIVECRVGEGGPTQAVAFTRQRDGAYRTIGTVVHSSPTFQQGAGPDIAEITALTIGDQGTVQATVRDRFGCCGVNRATITTQQRTYAWNGHGFQQDAGPTTFLGDHAVSDLRVTAGTVAVTPTGAPMTYTGTLTVTVTNQGPQAIADVRLVVSAYTMPMTGGDWSRFSPDGVCTIGSMNAGATLTFTLPLLVGMQLNNGKGTIGSAEVFADLYLYDTASIDVSTST